MDVGKGETYLLQLIYNNQWNQHGGYSTNYKSTDMTQLHHYNQKTTSYYKDNIESIFTTVLVTGSGMEALWMSVNWLLSVENMV